MIARRNRLQSGLCSSMKVSNASVHDKAHAHSTHQTLIVPALLEGLADMKQHVLGYPLLSAECLIAAYARVSLEHYACASATFIEHDRRHAENSSCEATHVLRFQAATCPQTLVLVHATCPMHCHNDSA